jgi:hypothetical protein
MVRGLGEGAWPSGKDLGTMGVLDRLTRALARGHVLVCLLIVSIAVSLGFGLVDPWLGGPLLDMVATPAANEARLAAMSAAQKTTHLQITLTLDLLYPIAYGGGLASLAARFAPRRRLLAVMPGVALVVVDLVENALIVAMLIGSESVIPAKALMTEIKWLLFGSCCLLAVGLAVRAIVRHYGCAAVCADA